MTDPGLPLTTGEGNTAARRHGRDYIERTIATVRNHRDADNCWPQWANIFADEIEAQWAERDALREQLDARDKAAKEEAHWHVHYAAEAAAQKNRADATLEQLDAARQALGDIDHIAMTRRVGGPSMDGSETFVSPAFKEIRDIARAALGVEGPAG